MANKKQENITVLGLMSGTSLDGLDLALCSFSEENGKYSFKIKKSKTVAYNPYWKDALKNAIALHAENYFKLNHEYGSFIAHEINDFIEKTDVTPDAIASHGHTVFHQPQQGFSVQIGSGASIAALTGIKTVCDFRSTDVALGGQGAPLVPIGDKLLFSEFEACLNIGGIANISFDSEDGTRQAFDICFANMGLNMLAEETGANFDEDGKMAAAGKPNEDLVKKLKQVFKMQNNVSLSREIFEKEIQPVLFQNNFSINDKLSSFTEAMAIYLSQTFNANKLKSIMITGGGAYNKHLINRIKEHYKGEVIIPSDEIIQFKEALIFAFLGYLRINEKTNTLKSVTNAQRDSIGGALYLP